MIDESKVKKPYGYLILVAYGVLILISLPLGFDQHHSGLILSSLNEYKVASYNGAGYPFNQYGPAWTLIFDSLLFLAPQNYYFLCIKLVGLIFVALALLANYKLSRLFLNKEWSILSVGWILITYPFFAGFLPWPSLIVMPIVPFVAFVLVKFSKPFHSKFSLFQLFLVGNTLGIALLTRAQIGLGLILATSVFILLSKNDQKWKWFVALQSGFLFNLAVIVLYLTSNGWLTSAFYDEFILGFKYVTGDKSTFPIPLGTIVLVLGLLTLTKVMRDKSTYLNRIRIKSTGNLFRFFAISAIVSIISLFWNERLFNRIWISFVIYIFICFLLERISYVKENPKEFFNDFNVLVVFSGIALTQIWPLFDQMHTWWAITPMAVVICVFFQRFETRFDMSSLRTFVIFPVFLTVFVIQMLVMRTTYLESDAINVPGIQGNLSFQSNVQEIEEIQSFFRRNIPSGSRVLNLCANGNLGFDGMRFKSASRNVVFWSTMRDNEDLFQDILQSKPEFVVKCNYTPFTSQLYNFSQLQNQVISNTLKSPIVAFELKLSTARTIQVLVSKNP